MKLIKIIRSSIKKNPNAGRREIHEAINRRVSFRFEGSTELPGFKEGKDYIKTEWGTAHFGDSGSSYIEGELIDYELWERVGKIPGIQLNITQDIRTHRFMKPEPDYNFKYKDTKIECLNCHNKILQSEIIDDEVSAEDDEYSVQKCPVCGAADEFEEIEYEKIEEVIKDLEPWSPSRTTSLNYTASS